jgi:hypothetical protein
MPTRPAPVIFHDTPYLVWLVVIGCAALGACLIVLGAKDLVAGAWMTGLPAVAIGIAGCVCSRIFSTYAERTVVTVDPENRRVDLVGQLPWRQRHLSWHFDEIETVEPEKWDDGDARPSWRPVLVMKTGQRIALIANWHSTPDVILDVCHRTGAALRG